MKEEIIKGEDLKKLTEYLIYHEQDISIGINDFADLRGVYKTIVGFEPTHEKWEG